MTDLLGKLLANQGRLQVGGVPDGYDALVVGDLARAATTSLGSVPVLHILRDDARLADFADALAFFGPDVQVIRYPAWDCQPYDRVSPHGDIIAARLEALTRLAFARKTDKPRVIVTTINAALQRTVSRDMIRTSAWSASTGDTVDQDQLLQFLVTSGYSRAGSVTEPGDFAVRGGLVDVFPPGAKLPFRLDFFGDELETIRRFDTLDQRTRGRVKKLALLPANELKLDADSRSRFRQGYLEAFGTVRDEDPLYAAISEGRMYQGAEHWLPLFHEKMETLFDFVPGALVTLDAQTNEAAGERLSAIRDYFDTRTDALSTGSSLGSTYKPLAPDRLYLSDDEWTAALDRMAARQLSPFQVPDGPGSMNFAARQGRDFSPERNTPKANIYDAVISHIGDLKKASKRIVIAGYSIGSCDRMADVLKDHGLTLPVALDSWADIAGLKAGSTGITVLALEHGFETPDLALITEQDILGDRLVRRARKSRRAADFISEVSTLTVGDLVVHSDHGVGRFEGLETISVTGAPHDCVLITYNGGDKLYVPVENIEVLSRYGADEGTAQLDKLGGGHWQARKAKLKKRIRDMADELIRIAAERELREGLVIDAADGLYQEFCARFPFVETEDQTRTISQVTADLASGRPMDRLVCGDVGFGKTEVALRSSFLTVMSGYQVAVVTPTTLLARQHFQTFSERFKGLPVRIRQLSRLVGTAKSNQTKEGMRDGQVDIVIGTHALLGKSIGFKRLGLLIVDEEQHFGVTHKERLKKLRADVHVLTLTATPIPRTLQLALTGIRDLSLIATPPVDRLAIRTFVTPFDEIILREAFLREHYRGGQSFFVCPRISDLDEAAQFLKDHVPEVKFIMAHGQMAPGTIEDVMTAFYEGQYDVLLSTTIIESGLDIPRANTLVVHRADMFGLAQLYQIRGRVGRSKRRAYAYLTVRPNRLLTDSATKRLEVLQSLDTLGAGFSLASYDMDIRGAGNLLGDEQSGHIREVGVELYQKMLEEAVAEARSGAGDEEADGDFSPQIQIGASVLIPEYYVPDLDLRMSLYRRLAKLTTREEIDGFMAEMIDRFGPVPDEAKQLLSTVLIKAACRRAGILKMEAGPKGATLSFRNDRFANPAGLIGYISKQGSTARLRPNHTLVYLVGWPTIEDRLNGVLRLATELAKVAEAAPEEAA